MGRPENGPGIETRRVEAISLSRPPPFAPTHLALALVLSYLSIHFTHHQIHTLLVLLHVLPRKDMQLV